MFREEAMNVEKKRLHGVYSIESRDLHCRRGIYKLPIGTVIPKLQLKGKTSVFRRCNARNRRKFVLEKLKIANNLVLFHKTPFKQNYDRKNGKNKL